MNPFNLILNYFIANSRANYYNVADAQEIQKTGLIAGMISENPLISYMLIESKAKDLIVVAPQTTLTVAGSTSTTTPSIPTTPSVPVTPVQQTSDLIIKRIEEKLTEMDKKMSATEKSITDLAQKANTNEQSIKENNTALKDISGKISEIPKISERITVIEKKVESISNIKPASIGEVKSITKK